MSIDEHCLEQCKKIARMEADIETLYRKVKTAEGTIAVIHELATSVAVMTEQIKSINTGIRDVNSHLESVDEKIEQIETTPAKEYNSIKQRAAHAVVDAIVTLAMAGLVWAIIQSGAMP